MLKVGDRAPTFTLKDQDGRSHQLSDYAKSWVVLYFYPRDNTPGCTKEACSFRDSIDVLRNINTEVIGISKDSILSHQSFIDRYNIPFTLLSDPEKEIIKKYGAWQKKNSFGREYYGTHRMTYLIDPKGKIAKIYKTVNPLKHVDQVIADLSKLQKLN